MKFLTFLLSALLALPVQAANLPSFQVASPPAADNSQLAAPTSWVNANTVTGFNSRQGAVTLNSGDVTGALGFTPQNAAPLSDIGNLGITAPSGIARDMNGRVTDWVNVGDYTGRPGQQLTSSVSITSGGSGGETLAVFNANFTGLNPDGTARAAAGDLIFIGGAGTGGAELATTILSVVDSQHVTVAAAAGTTLSASAQTVTWGPDSQAGMNQAVNVAENLSQWGSFSNAGVLVPAHIIVISAHGWNLTNAGPGGGVANGLTVQGLGGASIYCATAGKTCVDALGNYALQIRNLNITGDSVLEPQSAFVWGRIIQSAQTAAYGRSSIRDLRIRGSFSKPALLDNASETSEIQNVDVVNAQGGVPACALDGSYHWQVTSEYVSLSLTLDTAYTNTVHDYRTVRCASTGTGAGTTGMWLSNANGLTCSQCYWNSNGYEGITIWTSSGIRSHNLILSGNIENSADDVYFDTSGSANNTALPGLTLYISNQVATANVFNSNSLLTAIKIDGLELRIDQLVSGVGLWGANASAFQADGIIYSGSFANGFPLPGSWSGMTCFAQGCTPYNANVPGNPAATSAMTAAVGSVANLNLISSGFWSVPNGGAVFPTLTISAPQSGGTQATGAFTTWAINGPGTIGGTMSGFNVGDHVSPVGGTGTAPVFNVTAVNSGAISTMSAISSGAYTALPSSNPTMTWTAVTGSGTGLTTTSPSWKPTAVSLTAGGSGYIGANVTVSANANVSLITGTPSVTALTSALVGFQSLVSLSPITVAGLPSCSTTLKGATALVTDASSPTYGGTLTGGSSTYALALCNGTAWTAH